LQDSGHLNSGRLERQIVELAVQFVEDESEIAALLLECSDIPPYAWSIQRATQLPVFDFFTLIHWVHSALVRHSFCGYL
jgi:hypothetical protein